MLIRVDLLGSEWGAHFTEAPQEACVFDGGSLHALLLQRQQSSLEEKNKQTTCYYSIHLLYVHI